MISSLAMPPSPYLIASGSSTADNATSPTSRNKDHVDPIECDCNSPNTTKKKSINLVERAGCTRYLTMSLI